MERQFRPRLRQPLTKGQASMFDQGHRNPSEASGEHTAFAPALATHWLVAPNVPCCLLGLGRRLRAATYPQQPQRCHCYDQPHPLGSLPALPPLILPFPTPPPSSHSS